MGWTTYNSAGAALSQSLTDMPVGTITGYAGATAPSGWLLCDGSAVSRTTYAELFGVVSTTYGSGDGSTTFNVPDSSGFIILATSQAARLAAAALPQYVTSLPSSPVDGQTVVYAADATNGVMWTLRYRAASSSSYKWEFVGGPPLANDVLTQETTTSTTYTNLATTGPSLTVPLAGDYQLLFGCENYNNGANINVMSVAVGASAATDTEGAEAGMSGANKVLWSERQTYRTGVSASTAFVAKYRVTAGTGSWRNRVMRITPVRVG